MTDTIVHLKQLSATLFTNERSAELLVNEGDYYEEVVPVTEELAQSIIDALHVTFPALTPKKLAVKEEYTVVENSGMFNQQEVFGPASLKQCKAYSFANYTNDERNELYVHILKNGSTEY